MGENVLTLIRYLSSTDSPLPTLTDGYTPPSTVFFSYVAGLFFVYSFTTAKVMYILLFLASFVLVRITYVDPAPALKKAGDGFWSEQIKGGVAVTLGAVGTLVVPNLVAVVMKYVLNKGMSWFANPLLALGLYGPAAVLGMMIYLEIIGILTINANSRCFDLSIPRRPSTRTIRLHSLTPRTGFGGYQRAGSWHRFRSYFLPKCTPTLCGSHHQFIADGKDEKNLVVGLCHWSSPASVVGIHIDPGCD